MVPIHWDACPSKREIWVQTHRERTEWGSYRPRSSKDDRKPGRGSEGLPRDLGEHSPAATLKADLRPSEQVTTHPVSFMPLGL